MPDFTLFARQFPKFHRLSITTSGLKYVERRQLAKIPQLTHLDLFNNLIEHLPEDAFSDLVKLENLQLTQNKIKVLRPKLLWKLPKLKNFAAGVNPIELIPRDFFKNNKELEEIRFHNTKITRIEVDFTLLPKLKTISMDGSCLKEAFCRGCNIDQLREIQQKINRNCTGRA
jgi:Leucine-rich repeat (LRR) protein